MTLESMPPLRNAPTGTSAIMCRRTASGLSKPGCSLGATSPSSSEVSSCAKAAGASSSKEDEQGKARGQQADKKKGLDRADEVAGEHGKQGRDNAREKQGRD